MQVREFYKYVHDPSLMDPSVLPQLQKLVDDFPYFQPAHILLSMAAKRFDTALYQKTLRKTAIVVSNREHLFQLIHSIADDKIKEVPAVQLKEPVAAETKIPEPSKAVIEAQPEKEDKAEEEIALLKATEVATESPVFPASDNQPEVQLEKEIQKQVVNSFVEKEILKTPDLHKTPPAPQPESFGDWLSFLKKNNGQSYEDITQQVEKAKTEKEQPKADPAPEKGGRKLKNQAIIDRIIEKNPGLIRTKEEQKFYAPDIKAKESLLENEHLVTETLARIYALQGSVNKAVRAYEILSLKYPQKSAYFANLIQKLKSNS